MNTTIVTVEAGLIGSGCVKRIARETGNIGGSRPAHGSKPEEIHPAGPAS
jgi:hypothetical protein